jgi:hypothetical protein
MILLKEILSERHKNTPNERISKYKERIQNLKDKISKAKDKNTDTVKLQKNQIKVIQQTMNNFKQAQVLKKQKTESSSKLTKLVDEDLRKWFGKGKTGSTTGGGWDRYNSKGEKVGKCGDSKAGSAYAACLSKEKAAKLGPDGRAAFVKRKRAAQSKAGDAKKGGEKSKGQKPTFVKTGA